MRRRRVGVQRVRFCKRREVMKSLESRKTTIVPITAAVWTRPARGKFFLPPTGFGGGAKGGAKTGLRAGGAWHNKPSRSSAKRWEVSSDPYRIAFGLLYLFTLLLYARPNDLIPAMGTFPLAKIVAITAPLAYIYAQYRLGKPVIKWNVEGKMVIGMLLLAVLLTVFAASSCARVT